MRSPWANGYFKIGCWVRSRFNLPLGAIKNLRARYPMSSLSPTLFEIGVGWEGAIKGEEP
jgi:hypothetical protein